MVGTIDWWDRIEVVLKTTHRDYKDESLKVKGLGGGTRNQYLRTHRNNLNPNPGQREGMTFWSNATRDMDSGTVGTVHST